MKGSPLYQKKGDVFIVSLSWLRQLQHILALDIFESVSMSCFQQMRHSKPVLTCILDKVRDLFGSGVRLWFGVAQGLGFSQW